MKKLIVKKNISGGTGGKLNIKKASGFEISNKKIIIKTPPLPSSFSPASIAGLQLWLKADAGVSTNGSNVTEWLDQSVNNYSFFPDFETADITLSSSVASLNNKPAIFFQTSNDNGDVGLTNDTAGVFIGKSVFLVYILDEVSDFEYSVPYENNGINNYTSYNNGNRVFGGYMNGFYNASTLSTLDTPYIRTTISDDGANPIDFYLNGNADGSPAGGGFYNFRNEIVIGNGGARQAGPSPSINQPFQGYIAEVIVYDNAISAGDRISVENYLNDKYAIY